jgi:hypothetical protein
VTSYDPRVYQAVCRGPRDDSPAAVRSVATRSRPPPLLPNLGRMGDQGSSARVVTAARTPPGCQELLGRAEALPPLLRDKAASGEADRSLPDEVVTRLSEAGLFRMLTPNSLDARVELSR